MRVQVYTSSFCSYCVAAKALLARRKIEFEEIDLSRDDEKRAWLAATTKQKTVPQIFIDGAPIGGFRELVSLDKAGELARMGLPPQVT